MNDNIQQGDSDALAPVSGGAVAEADAKAEVVNQKEADRIRIRVIQLRDQMSEGYFEMGRLLHRISVEGLYTQWRRADGQRYDTFRDWVEDEVDFAFRKAKHLMSIWWWFVEELKNPGLAEQVKEIGWTKAAILVGVVDSKNAKAWIDKAKVLKLKELEDEARKALEKAGKQRPSRPSSGSGAGSSSSKVGGGGGGAGGTQTAASAPASEETADAGAAEEPRGVDPLSDDESRDHRTRWTVLMDGTQRTNVEQAIDCASQIAEVEADSKGFLLDFIATAFLALHAGSGGVPADRKVNMRNDILMATQRALGIDIVAFEAGTSHAIFGKSTIDRVAAEAGVEDAD